MKVVWDEPKRLANLDKHGLDFANFEAGFDWSTAVFRPARIGRTGRARLRVIGYFEARLVSAIISPLGSEAVALVSLRVANATERADHDES